MTAAGQRRSFGASPESSGTGVGHDTRPGGPGRDPGRETVEPSAASVAPSPAWRARLSAARHGPHNLAPGSVGFLQILHFMAGADPAFARYDIVMAIVAAVAPGGDLRRPRPSDRSTSGPRPAGAQGRSCSFLSFLLSPFGFSCPGAGRPCAAAGALRGCGAAAAGRSGILWPAWGWARSRGAAGVRASGRGAACGTWGTSRVAGAGATRGCAAVLACGAVLASGTARGG